MRTLVIALVLALATPARADTDYFAKHTDATKVTVQHRRARTTNARLLIGGLVLGAAATGGLGVYFNLQSRDVANQLSAVHSKIVGVWTPALQATYDRGQRDGSLAIAGYALAGAFLAGTIVAIIWTNPGSETTQLAPTAEVVHGGAVVGGTVHF
jgi:hypothetical protein